MNRITPCLRTRNLITAHQFGFREKHGTIEQVKNNMRKTEILLRNIQNKSNISPKLLICISKDTTIIHTYVYIFQYVYNIQLDSLSNTIIVFLFPH